MNRIETFPFLIYFLWIMESRKIAVAVCYNFGED